MRDALGAPQTILVIGGTSEIGLAIVRAFLAHRPADVLLAGRDQARLAEAASGLRAAGARSAGAIAFDALDTEDHEAFAARCFDALGDVDVVVVAVGLLGDERAAGDAMQTRAIVETNFLGLVSAIGPVAARLREQGHGALVALSSVAVVRPRAANFVYGAAKAGFDYFVRGLAEQLHGSGVRVLVVRPGFVRTRMTQGLRPAPFSVGPDAVGAAVVGGLRRGAGVTWVPGTLRWVMAAVWTLPPSLFRRIAR